MAEHLLRMTSPIGRLELTSDGEAITSLTIECEGALPHDDVDAVPDEVLYRACDELDEYFAGRRHGFDIPLAPHGTPFQCAVWSRLAEIPWGDHTTYGGLGAAVGRPTASRAVGQAIGSNPIPLLIGCHRVLGSGGRITGYSGGEGIPTKLWLLAHEGIVLAA